jgi:hypothetical protein
MFEINNQPPPGEMGGQPKFDNGHASHHFLEGKYHAPLTQKARVDGATFHVDTPVDGNGNVGESSFSWGKQ